MAAARDNRRVSIIQGLMVSKFMNMFAIAALILVIKTMQLYSGAELRKHSVSSHGCRLAVSRKKEMLIKCLENEVTRKVVSRVNSNATVCPKGGVCSAFWSRFNNHSVDSYDAERTIQHGGPV